MAENSSQDYWNLNITLLMATDNGSVTRLEALIMGIYVIIICKWWNNNIKITEKISDNVLLLAGCYRRVTNMSPKIKFVNRWAEYLQFDHFRCMECEPFPIFLDEAVTLAQ